MNFTKIKNRVIADYFAPSRSDVYREILELALEHNYHIMALSDFYKHYKAKTLRNTQKILCLRHDVDIINPKATETFFKIEKSLEVKATYYFRFYTVNHNLELLDALHANSYEVGYHFEEIATYAKQNYIKNREFLISKLDEIRNIFIENFHKFKACYVPQMNSICSHGDWINVKFDLPNHTLVSEELLNELHLYFEAYQPKFVSLFDVYISDVAQYPQRWKEISAQSAIENNVRKIYMLTHERFWFTSPYHNTRANIKTLSEQLTFKLKS